MPLFQTANQTELRPEAGQDELSHWQDRIAFTFLLIGVIFGFFVLIFSVHLAIKEELWLVAGIDTAIYIWVVVLYFRKSFPPGLRSGSIAVLCYVLGMILLLTIGPFGGGGPVWLFFFPIITGLLTNVRYAILSLAINVLTVLLIGLSVHFSWYEWPFTPEHAAEKWVVLSANFILLDAIATLATAIVIRGLRKSLSAHGLALDKLEATNRELQDYNRRLLEEMKERQRAETMLLHSEEALQESKIKFEELVELLPIAYLFADRDKKLVFANRKAQLQLNIDESHIGTVITRESLHMQVKTSPEAPQIACDIFDEEAESAWTPYTYTRSDGSPVPVEAFFSKVSREHDLLGYQGLVVDISDRIEKEELRKAKDIAERANKAISEWVDFIAHELRSPVTGITGFSDIGLMQMKRSQVETEIRELSRELHHNHTDPEKSITLSINKIDKIIEMLSAKKDKLSDYFRAIMSSAFRLNRLLSELLDLSKLETGNMLFNMNMVDLLEVILNARKEFEPLIQKKNLTIRISNREDPITIECDEFRMGQVFRNLLSNAVKFSRENGKIDITIEKTSMKSGRRNIDSLIPGIHIVVADEGIGVPADQISIIFDKFKQSRKTKVGEGTGLGLPICREIVSAHRGSLWVESRENEGSRFHLNIPVAQGMN